MDTYKYNLANLLEFIANTSVRKSGSSALTGSLLKLLCKCTEADNGYSYAK
jgi:hypothetical protein